ncbi:MAG TPA: N-acetylmuramoyl-L-alanine amidase [Candidatus Sulfotelmatobacter sp.]|nr:N-acetylmuramoyl-L-alanine amidase [Candidatus Sulfotelmatobacter sp.]
MRRFAQKDKIRNSLLRGVYEQNLAILGVRTASIDRHRPALRRGLLSLFFFGAILFGQTIPLGPSLQSGTTPSRPVVQQSPQASAGEVASNVGSGASADTGRAAPIDASDAAEYQNLAKGGPLEIRKVFGLGVKTIMIDAGHGGEHGGAVGKGGTPEKTITLDIAQRLKAILEHDTDYRILMTRDEDRDVSLKGRVDMANTSKADLFISIHVNSLIAKSMDIVETYYFGPTRDADTLALAAEVNDGSDYSYREYNEIIKKIANQLKYEESRLLARSVQDVLYQNMKRRNPDVLDFGVKRAPFVVLLGVEMPAVLVEVGCLSNTEEEARLKDPAYRQTIASYIETGIIKYLGGKPRGSRLS